MVLIHAKSKDYHTHRNWKQTVSYITFY